MERYRYTFDCETAEVTVEHDLYGGDYAATVRPHDEALPTEELEVHLHGGYPQPFHAAADALDTYKKRHGLPAGEIWKL